MTDTPATVAALFVQTNGAYFNLPGVDPWDIKRDARKYEGPHPVVAHPPCARWCRLAGLVEKRWGHKRGEDDGCFASALASVRTFGGVLEHPAYSDAWSAFGIARPPRQGGWVATDKDVDGQWRPYPGGYAFTCHVEQGRYGHMAKKATWLYAVVPYLGMLPELKWGSDPDQRSKALVSWCGNHVASGEVRPRVGKAAASKTPPEFREALLTIPRRVVEHQSKRQRNATPSEFRDLLLAMARGIAEGMP